MKRCRCNNPQVVECQGDSRRLDYYCRKCGKNYHPDPVFREPDTDPAYNKAWWAATNFRKDR